MTGNSFRISTDQVAQVASTMETLNKRLSEELTKSRTTVEQLSSVWEGEAASATIAAFRAFAEKYFQKYEDVITQYVRFLRMNVEQGYIETETANVKLADGLR